MDLRSAALVPYEQVVEVVLIFGAGEFAKALENGEVGGCLPVGFVEGFQCVLGNL